MFGMFRAGGYAAAAIALTATSIGAGPSQALNLQSAAFVPGVAHEVASGAQAVAASDQLSPQIIVPVTREQGPTEVEFPRDADVPADVQAAITPPADTPAAPAPRIYSSLAAMVAAHRSTSVPNRERECLAGAIYFESKGEPLPGQVAVGQVIANRAKSGRFPKSWCGVVFQRSQFSFVRGGGLPPIPRSSAQWKTAVAVAHIVANDMHDAVAPNALFFHARYVSPGWKRLSRVATVGNHIFYR